MAITVGYESDINGNGVRVITPPLLADKITVSSTENTSRWVFYGTRSDILDWIKNHASITLENGLFSTGRPVSFSTHTELVIDLLAYADPDQSYLDYFKSWIQTDFQNEKVKVEIRPRVESKDRMISTLCRLIVKSGVSLEEVLPDLEQEWYRPSHSYVEQANDVLNDRPGPVHILSSDTPMDVQVVDQDHNSEE